jgi:hypothetical protein
MYQDGADDFPYSTSLTARTCRSVSNGDDRTIALWDDRITAHTAISHYDVTNPLRA